MCDLDQVQVKKLCWSVMNECPRVNLIELEHGRQMVNVSKGRVCVQNIMHLGRLKDCWTKHDCLSKAEMNWLTVF